MTYGAKLRQLRAHVNGAVDVENRLGGKAQKPKSSADPTPLSELLEASVAACKAQRKRKRDADNQNRPGQRIEKTAPPTRYARV